MEDGGGDVGRLDGSVGGDRADRVACTDDPPSLHSATGETDGETLRPVVATTGRIHARGSAELGEVADEGRVEESALVEVFDQRAYKLDRTRGKRCRASLRSR